MGVCLRRLLRLSSVAFTASLAGAALAAPPAGRADQIAEIRLEAGPLNVSLFTLAKQTGVQIVFTSQMVEGRQAPAVSGRLSADQALERLIAGSDLQIQRAGDRVLVLRPRGGLFSTAAVRGAGDPAALEPTQGDPAAPPSPAVAVAEDPTLLSEIVVGSHLRGVKDGASPVIVLSRQDLERDGRASVADALAALPQNFGGEASEDTASTGADPLATNSSSASGVDLRGLGADATLVLVNGRRLAGTGLKGDFADVSSIPMSAVDRVEILLDGASALYGSDAVGGVVNIVLKTRYDGAETRLLTGGATQGGATQVVFGQTVGKTWDSGHAPGVLRAFGPRPPARHRPALCRPGGPAPLWRLRPPLELWQPRQPAQARHERIAGPGLRHPAGTGRHGPDADELPAWRDQSGKPTGRL
jgi:iron complex outermembrane receptor protein